MWMNSRISPQILLHQFFLKLVQPFFCCVPVGNSVTDLKEGINGVIHTAGVPDYEGVIQRRTAEMTKRVMAPKVQGTFILEALLKEETLDAHSFEAIFA